VLEQTGTFVSQGCEGMKENSCGSCKYGKSEYETRGIFFDKWQRFYVKCIKLDGDEITPILHDFIATCGCASFKKDVME
jgi:hypothetical protein